MSFLTPTNNQNIGNSDFQRDTNTSLNLAKDDPQGSGGCKSESPSPRWIVKHNSQASLTRNLLVFWRQMLTMHTSVFSYYQDLHQKPDR